MIPILLHNTYAKDPEKLFALAWKAGYNGVEMASPGLKQKISDIAPGIENIARLKEKYLCNELVLHFPMLLMNDEQWNGKEEYFERMSKAFELASKKLGVKKFNTMAAGAIIPEGNKYTDYHLNGSAAANEDQWERAFSMLRTASKLASQHDIELVVESHGCLIHDSYQACLRLMNELDCPNVKLNLDVANIVLTKTWMLTDEELAPLLPLTSHLHLKNLRFVLGGGVLLESVANGEIQYEPILRKVIEESSNLTCSLEFPGRFGDMEAAAHNDLRFVREILGKINK